MTRKCICQICCCGRHRCPHNPSAVSRVINKTNIEHCQVSEYGKKFRNVNPSRGPFNHPRDLIVPEGDHDHVTVHKTEFVPHQTQIKHFKKIEEYIPSTAPMDLESEYRGKFAGEKIEPARMPAYLKQVTQRLPSGKMPHETVHKNDYKPWKTERVNLIRRRDVHEAPAKPFSDTSTHRNDFIDFQHKPLPKARQPDMLKLEGKFHMETSNKFDFKPYKSCPEFIKRKASYKPMTEPFTGNSLIREDFPDHHLTQKPKIFKPVSTILLSKSPMQSDTTHNNEFKYWEPSSIGHIRHKEIYEPPTGLLDLKTTSSDYCVFGTEGKPAKSARPKTKLRTGRDGEFDGTSNYKEQFQFWNSKPAKPIRLQEELRKSAPAALKFTDTSEHREKFHPHSTAPANIFKPTSSLFHTKDGLDDVSQYRKDFKGESIQDCPSKHLLKLGEFSGVRFEDDPETGHRFIKSFPQQSVSLPSIANGANLQLDTGNNLVSP